MFEFPAVVIEKGPERAGKTDPRLLERLPGGTTVQFKKAFGLAAEPAALDAIKATQRKTVVMIGFETDTCVARSAIELHDLGFRVVAVEDAMYRAAVREHERGLRRMQHVGVERHDCKGISYEWPGVVDAAIEVIRASAEKYGPAPVRL